MLDLERLRWEGQEALAPGKHTVVYDFKHDAGRGFGKGGTGVLKVDGKGVATKTMPRSCSSCSSPGYFAARSAGRFTNAQQKELRRICGWFVEIPGVSIGDCA